MKEDKEKRAQLEAAEELDKKVEQLMGPVPEQRSPAAGEDDKKKKVPEIENLESLWQPYPEHKPKQPTKDDEPDEPLVDPELDKAIDDIASNEKDPIPDEPEPAPVPKLPGYRHIWTVIALIMIIAAAFIFIANYSYIMHLL